FGFGAQSEIVIPPRQYPNGYTADVRGGAIVSAPGARVLRVVACGSADVVFATVARGSGPPQSSCAIRTPFNAITPLRVTVSPKRVRVNRRVTIKAVVRAGPRRKVVRGAVVRLAGRRAVTGRHGRVVFRIRFTRAGRRAVVAKARDYQTGKAT